MRDLVEYIIKGIVGSPDEVVVSEERNDQEVKILVQVNPQDMGVVIGRNGQTIKAIRKLVTVRAMAENVRVTLHLQEPEGGIANRTEQESL